MGDVQSTQRGSSHDAAAEEESRGVENPRAEQNAKHETFRNSEQSSEISRKGEEVTMTVCHEDENGAQGLPLIPTKEAALETRGNEEEPQGEVHNDGVRLEITELDVKQSDVNSFGRFFSNIGLKLTINRGSGEKAGDDNKETGKGESEETETEKTEGKTDPTRLILSAVASEHVLENVDKTAETREEPELQAEPEQEPRSTNPTGPRDAETDSPIRRFFAAVILSGLWKKKEAGDETTERETEEKGGERVTETAGKTAQERPDEEPTSPGELRDEIPGKSPEPDNLASPERDRVQMSPLLRFLSGSSLRRLSTKQRDIRSSEARLCDSGEPDPAELRPSEPAEERRNAPAPASAEEEEEEEEGEEEEEEEGAWASFKRFMSPKPRMKTEQPASGEEPRAAPTSEPSSDEGKKRKNSSVSWEAVLCGSGRRRSRKTSDSEDEMPPIDLKHHREDGKPKSGRDSGAENERETTSPNLDGSPQEDDRTSTWKSLKRIVTPKRKSRDEEEAIKIKTQADGEGGQENPSFSIKNLLPGRKKQRSEESQGRLSSDEAQKAQASDDDDSETPGVVPLSEFEVEEEENEIVEEKDKSDLQQDHGPDRNLCVPQDFDEDSEKRERKEGPDDGTELASKHQQLSVISEEGATTEPWATLASAVAAAEPEADLTLQDDTEMFTAASQFSSDSAKTSGNATPVPAEGRLVQTETVSQEADRTFWTSPKKTASSSGESTSGVAQFRSVGFKSEVAVEELDGTDRTEVEDEEQPSAGGEDMQDVSDGIVKLKELNDCTGLTEDRHQLVEASRAVEEPGASRATSSLASDKNNVTSVETEQNADNSPKEEIIVEDKEESIVTKDTLESEEASIISEEAEAVKAVWSPVLGSEEDNFLPDLDTDEDKIETKLMAGDTYGPVDDGRNVCMSAHPTPEASEPPSLVKKAACDHVSQEEQVLDQPKWETILTLPKLQSVGPSETDGEAEVPQVQQSIESAEPEMTFKIILTEETIPDEPTEELKLQSKITLEPKGPLETDGKAEVKKVLQQSLESENLERISGEETVPGEPRDETTVAGETSSEPVDESKTVEAVGKPKAVGASAFMSEDSSRSTPTAEGTPENILKVELDTAENPVETVLVTAVAPEAKHDEEPELFQTVQAGDERTAAGETIIEPVDDSETAVVEEELGTVETSSSEGEKSSISPYEPEETSENTEAAKNENKPTTLHNEYPSEPEDAAQVLKEPEELKSVLQAERQTLMKEEPAAEEPKDVKPVVTESFFKKADDYKALRMSLNESEESSISSSGPEASSKNVLQADSDTDQQKTQTTIITEDMSEPLDDPQNAEGAELLPAVQPSSEKIHVFSLEAEEISEITSQAETVPHEIDEEKEVEPEDLKNVAELESELPSMVKDATSEEKTVLDEPKQETFLSDTNLQSVEPSETGGEAEVPQVLQQFLESGESIEEPSDNIYGEETVPGEPRDETTAAGETSSEPVDESKTVEAVGKPKAVGASAFMSEDSSRSTPTAEGTPENILKVELDTAENPVETVLVTAEAPEAKHDEEPELFQTVQASFLGSEDNSVLSAEPEMTSEIIVTEGTISNEPKEKLKLQTEITLEPEEHYETDGEAQILKNVHPQSLESEERREQSAEGEETSDNISEETTDEPRHESRAACETSSEPVDDCETVKVVEELETVETASFVKEESIISPCEPEETSEDILKTEPDVDENKVERCYVTEEQPEFSQSVQSSALESEDNSAPSSEQELTNKIILSEETVPDEPGDERATIGGAICGQEPAEDVKELQTWQTSSQEEHKSSSPPEAEGTSDMSKAEAGSDETKKEITLKPEDTESSDGAEAVMAVNPTPESGHPPLAQEATWAHISGEKMVPGAHKEETINDILDPPTAMQELELQVLLLPSLESGELEVKSNNVPQAETDTVFLTKAHLEPAEPEILKTVQAVLASADSFESAEASDQRQVTAESEEKDLAVETTTDDLKTEQVKQDERSGTETEPVEEEDPAAPHMDQCHPQDVSEEEPQVLREQTSEALMDTMQAEVVKVEVDAATPSVTGGVAEEVEEGKAEDAQEEVAGDATPSEGTTVLEVEDTGVAEEGKVQVDDQVEEKESATVQATGASQSPPVTGAKEEDEWRGAEENIDTQEEKAGSFYEAEEPLRSQRGGEDAEQAGLERDAERARASRVEVEGSEDTNEAGDALMFESEEEDFEVALERPGSTSMAAVSLTG